MFTLIAITMLLNGEVRTETKVFDFRNSCLREAEDVRKLASKDYVRGRINGFYVVCKPHLPQEM
jgi:hypothetical protein